MTIPENWASIDPPISNSPTLTSIINHSSSSKQSTTSKKHSSQYSEEDDSNSDESESNSENSEDETVSTDSGSECSASSCSTCSDEYDSEESDSSCSSISSDHRKVKEKLKKQQNNISSNSKSRFIVESRSAPKPLTKTSVVSDFDHVNHSSPVMSQFKSGSISQAETLNAISQKSSSKLVTVQQPSKKNKSSNANVTRKFFKRKQQQQLQQQEIQQLQTLHNNATVRICRFFYGSQLPFSSTKACKII